MKKNNKATLMILLRKRALALVMRKQKVSMITNASHYWKMMYCAPSKTNRQYQEAGYYWTAITLWMCSAIPSYSVTFVTKCTLNLYCNAAKAFVNKKGDLKGYDTVWYHPEGIANILSLYNVHKKHKVTSESSQAQDLLYTKWMVLAMYSCLPLRGYSSLMLRAILPMS